MAKAAYDDRNSEYGWNLDHIFPLSKGGKTADYNLICCHILTNDEKADKICFNANGQPFKVIKVENHYEIVGQSRTGKEEKQPTFFDSAYGVRRFEQLAAESTKGRFWAEIFVNLREMRTSAVLSFLQEIFPTENIAFQLQGRYPLAIIRSYDVGLKEQIKIFWTNAFF